MIRHVLALRHLMPILFAVSSGTCSQYTPESDAGEEQQAEATGSDTGLDTVSHALDDSVESEADAPDASPPATRCEDQLSELKCLSHSEQSRGEADRCQWVQVARYEPDMACPDQFESAGMCVTTVFTGEGGCPSCQGRGDDLSPFYRVLPDGSVEVHGRYQCGMYAPDGWSWCNNSIDACGCACDLAPPAP